MKSIQLISAQDAGSNITSIPVDLGDLRDFSIHIDFSGATLGGSLTLQASNDQTDFVTVSGSTQVIASAASHVYNVQGAAYRYVRLTWTQTGGAGTMTATAVLKEALPSKGA